MDAMRPRPRRPSSFVLTGLSAFMTTSAVMSLSKTLGSTFSILESSPLIFRVRVRFHSQDRPQTRHLRLARRDGLHANRYGRAGHSRFLRRTLIIPKGTGETRLAGGRTAFRNPGPTARGRDLSPGERISRASGPTSFRREPARGAS